MATYSSFHKPLTKVAVGFSQPKLMGFLTTAIIWILICHWFLQISDEGGGIPRSGLAKIFTYVYSTAKNPLDEDYCGVSNGVTMAGYGYGLPISRLYARYFGGDLQIISMEGYGKSKSLFSLTLDIKFILSCLDSDMGIPMLLFRFFWGAWEYMLQKYMTVHAKPSNSVTEIYVRSDLVLYRKQFMTIMC